VALKVQAGSGELHPEGWFRFQIKAVEEIKGDFGPRLKWRLKPSQKDGHGVRYDDLNLFTPARPTPKNALGALIEAASGEACQPGREYDMEDFCGSIIEGLVEHKEGRNGGDLANVTKVRYPRQQAPAAPATVQVPPPAPAPEPGPSGFRDPFADE
jgi:hypothetical protein